MLIKALIIFLVILSSTFGWRLSRPHKARFSEEEKKISKNLYKIVSVLSQEIGPRNYSYYDNLNKSAHFIIQSFQELGYSVEIFPYNIDGKKFMNISAERLHHDDSGSVLIVGAHYDSCFNPGADDNASGVAAMLELARLLKDEQLSHRLKFVAFVNEEPPFFQTDQMGSFVYVQGLESAAYAVKAAVILETLGFYSDKPFSQKYLPLLGPFYPNKADFVAVVGNFASKALVKNIYSGFKENSAIPIEKVVLPGFIPGVNYSDHWSFWKKKIPAVMVTDTAYLRNRHYHKQSDLPDTLNFNKMARVVYGLSHALVKLDQDMANPRAYK